MQPQDPLEEIDLGGGITKRLTYISANIDPKLRLTIINILNEFKDYFSWDYNKMISLSRELMELKLPIKPGKSRSSICLGALRQRSCSR